MNTVAEPSSDVSPDKLNGGKRSFAQNAANNSERSAVKP